MNKFFIKKTILFIFTAGLIVIGSFYFGYQRGIESRVNFVGGSDSANSLKPEEANKEKIDLTLFWEAWKTLKEKYVDAQKISDQDLLYGAISGLASATKDPYTVFMPPSNAQEFSEDIKGEFGGIGIEIGMRNSQLTVITPLKGTPAEKAGLKSGDYILKINNGDTAGMSIDEAVKKIRGVKGTKVKLGIFRESWKEPKDFEIIRDIIQVPTLDSKFINERGQEDELNGKIFYVHLYNFYEKAPLIFYQAAFKTFIHPPKAVILDLRNNPGGYLEASVNIAGWFLNQGDVVVKEKFSSGEIQAFNSNGLGLFRNVPVVVLLNGGSASASEILAGALRDNRSIKIVGEKSFGKGSVQEIANLKDNSLLKVTVAKWLTPRDQIIDKNGITPDYSVKITDEDTKNNKDPQLEKALEVARAEMSQ